MDWIQTLTIIITVLGSAYYIHRDIKEDMKVQSARSDRLYEIWCTTQKEIADIRKETAEMWSETQKEIKEIYKDWSKERK